jgi:V-type H+-transporting ATPase subunit a
MSRGSDDAGNALFTVWYQTAMLGRKLTQIGMSYGATVFEFPLEDCNIDTQEQNLATDITDLTGVLARTYQDNRAFLNELRDSYWFWWYFFARETLIYKHIDFGDFARLEDAAIYRGWVPKRLIPRLDPLLDEATTAAGSAQRITYTAGPPETAPPTWIETNEFTGPFQLLNDSYGFADYDEVNGGAFYAMYPFLFGIMFGDVGHAFIYLIAAVAMIVLAPRVLPGAADMVRTIFGFRYFLLLMAVCGMYNGIIYNEWFGLPINIFGSRWTQNEADLTTWDQIEGNAYPIGVDPVWMFKDNELIFTNSMKMKISVVVGITQMVVGMILQLIKQVRKKEWIQLWLGWLPQMMYLGSFFVYMVVIIIIKWCQDEDGDGINLIQTLINIILQPGSVDKELFDGQVRVQTAVLVIFVSSIPIMLIIKPIVEMIVHGIGNGILEVFVITLIEVIEFTLSALSHTASYLRLWALSLAHSQLSHVLYEEIFILTTNSGLPPLMFIGFAGWAGGTVAILLGMECFSSLLHGIRLMWVEFSSKFYSGTGYEFLPLSFKKELAALSEDE